MENVCEYLRADKVAVMSATTTSSKKAAKVGMSSPKPPATASITKIIGHGLSKKAAGMTCQKRGLHSIVIHCVSSNWTDSKKTRP